MSKKLSSSVNSNPQDSQVYEVEKIVNQRILNGKKQYKVIWVGYSFEEATWEPQENLRCPQKINEFLRRYQDVIRRKNLMNKNPNDPNVQALQKSKVAEPQKVSIQKTQPSLQKPIINQTSLLNKDKLQSSLQKSSVINEKKNPDIESLKSKIMDPKSTLNPNISRVPDQHKREMNEQNSGLRKDNQFIELNSRNLAEISLSNEKKNQATKNMISLSAQRDKSSINEANKSQITKVIKIQNKSDSFNNRPQNKIQSKLESQIFLNTSQQIIPSKKSVSLLNKVTNEPINIDNFYGVNQILQERKISSPISQQESRSEEDQHRIKQDDIFMNVGERLEIQTIFGTIDMKHQQASQLKNAQKIIKNPKFFLIKNKFSEKQKIVERQRIILENPLQLINYYENLLIK